MGRDQQLDTLYDHLQQSHQVAISAIAGMGGIGKTELARQYGLHHLQQKTYPGGVCWLQVRDQTVGVQILNYAKAYLKLNPPEDYDDLKTQIAYCWHNWPIPSNPPYSTSDVLLIFDDVSDYSDIEKFIPSDPRFKILVTTRKQWLAESFQQLPLTVLDESAAEELLATLIGENRLQQEPQQVKLLCEELGYLPLGLELVGRYLKRKPNLSLAEMRSRLNLDHNALQKRDRKGEAFPDMTAKRGVKAALELSWRELDEDEQELACLLSVFALATIAWEWVEQTQPEQDIEELEDIRDDVLVNLSLLQDEGENTYQLHPLIREFLKYKREQRESADNMKQAVCKTMVGVAKTIPDTPTREDILAVTPAIAHITEVAEVLTDWLRDEDLIFLLTALSRFYNNQGLYFEAESWYKKDLEICRTRFGENHPHVATSLNNLALFYKNQGKYKEAESFYQQAIEMSQQLLGDSHPEVATSLNNLAELYRFQGKYTEAEPLFQQALQMKQQLLGEYHPDVASSLNNLALLYYDQSKYAEAEPLLQQALQIRQELLGSHHPHVAQSLNNLAELYRFQGKYTEAEPLFQQALQMKQQLLGEYHPNVAASLNNLASLYHSQGKYAEAEPLLQQALQIKQELLGEYHPDVAQSRNNLASLYTSQGKYTEAKPLYLKAVKIADKTLGEDHPNTQIYIKNYHDLLKQVAAESRQSKYKNYLKRVCRFFHSWNHL